MRLFAIVCSSCTPSNYPDPVSCHLNALENPIDQVRLIGRMADQGIQTILVKAVMLIPADPVYGPRLTNCWLPAATWVKALYKTGLVDAAIIVNVRKFNTAMSKAPLFGSVMSRFDGSNLSGVFRVSYQHQHFYFVTRQGTRKNQSITKHQSCFKCPTDNDCWTR